MDLYSRRQTSDDELLRTALLHAADERQCMSVLLADIAEIESRRLFAPAGYSSLFHYCTDALKLSDDAAQRRIHAARIARRFPSIYAMCADGRLSLTTVNLLAPRLTEVNADELLGAAAGKSKGDIAAMVARLAPRTEPIGWMQPLSMTAESHAPARVDDPTPGPALAHAGERHVPARVTPIASQRFAVQCAVGTPGADALRFARDTTGADVSGVVEAALLLYAEHLRKRKSGATAKPVRRPRPTRSARHVPAQVGRAVWERDGGQCTFTSDDGHRCASTRRLQYDHIVPVARGGESTADNVRLRCSTHNQHEADRVFGTAFMQGKRERARLRAAGAKACTAEEIRTRAERDVMPALLALGYRKAQAQYAASFCESLPEDATLEQRVKHALRQLLPAHRTIAPGACVAPGEGVTVAPVA